MKAYQEQVDGYQKGVMSERIHDHVYIRIDTKKPLSHPSRRGRAGEYCAASSKD